MGFWKSVSADMWRNAAYCTASWSIKNPKQLLGKKSLEGLKTSLTLESCFWVLLSGLTLKSLFQSLTPKSGRLRADAESEIQIKT